MELALVGLGRMGAGMARRLLADGHDVSGFDLDASARAGLERDGGAAAESLEGLVGDLAPPRNVWVMVPHGEPTRRTVAALVDLLEPDDLIVDGGNSRYTDSLRHAGICAEGGIRFLDVGVSGGVWGEEEGFNLMVGGPPDDVGRLAPVFRSLAPEDGWARVGGHGAGHFVKMIHNAVEYAMLQAIGEGFEALHRSQFDVDPAAVAELWGHGSVIRSWLLELAARAFREEGRDLERIEDWVDDSGTGRWTVHWAVENAVPLPAITTSLYERFASRQEEAFRAEVIAALRNQFGGHALKEEEEEENGGEGSPEEESAGRGAG